MNAERKETDASVWASSTRASASSAESLGGYTWYVILLLAVVNVFNYMDRMALSVLLPQIKADLNLSDKELGLLVGFSFVLFYAICGLPIARWADRGVRKNIIAIGLATWSIMTAVTGFAQNLWHLFVARMGVGMGEAGCLPPAQSILCDYVPLPRRSGVFAIHNFGLLAGMMVGMALAGWLGESLGWRWTFVVIGLPGVALAAIVWTTLREPARGHFDDASAKQANPSFGETLRFLWRCRTYRLLLINLIVSGFAQYGLYQWWPSFFSRVFGLSLSWVGVYLGVAIGIGSGIGMLAGGWLADRAARKDIGLPLRIGGVATAMAIPFALASLFVSSGVASMACVFMTIVFWSVPTGPVVAAVYSVTLPRMRATAGAANVFATSVLGFGLGPFCVGLLSDLLMPAFGHESLRFAFLAPIALLPVMVAVFFVIAKQLPNDLRRS